MARTTTRTTTRKASATSATPISAGATATPSLRRVKSPAFMLGTLGLGLAVMVGAVLIGRSDSGQIDVAAAVRDAGTLTDADGNQIDAVNVPSAEFRNMPNGGLVPQDPNAAPAPAPEESNASSTSESGGDSATTTPDESPEDSTTPETPAEDTVEETPEESEVSE